MAVDEMAMSEPHNENIGQCSDMRVVEGLPIFPTVEGLAVADSSRLPTDERGWLAGVPALHAYQIPCSRSTAPEQQQLAERTRAHEQAQAQVQELQRLRHQPELPVIFPQLDPAELYATAFDEILDGASLRHTPFPPARQTPRQPSRRTPFVPPPLTEQLAVKAQQALAEAQAEGLTLEKADNVRSGYKGVTQSSAISFRAVTYEGRRQVRLGNFPTVEQAALSYARHLRDRASPVASETCGSSEDSESAAVTSSGDVFMVDAVPAADLDASPSVGTSLGDHSPTRHSCCMLSAPAPSAAAPKPSCIATFEMSFEHARACRGVCLLCEHGLERACKSRSGSVSLWPSAGYAMQELFT